MEIRQLQSFKKIVELQSFSKAAKALGYTQAAVTIQIKQLEEEFGKKFFDRVGRKILLTPPGEEFLMYANEILEKIDQVHNNLGNPEDQSHKLRIGCLESLLSYKIPEVVKYFYDNYPEANIQVSTGSPTELIDMMEKNMVDIIYILDRPLYSSNWVKIMEEEEPIIFVSSPNMLKCNSSVELEDILSNRFFLTEKGSNYRYALEQKLASLNLTIDPFFESGDTDTIIHLLKRNKALSFLPLFSVKNAVDEKSLDIIPVKDFKISMSRQIFYHKSKYLTEEMKIFIKLAEEGML